ncbi:MAG: L-2-amino-thiazoline-4-carboxylic acid hydrolase [Spirochaetes bacterium]|nr:L-2-amino-thiazoline-4-carboxylic acid hydrolase [Spirochaetota bacterium]
MQRRLFSKTHWAHEDTEEFRYVRRLAPLAALYRIISERVGQGEALRIAARMFVPIGVCEQWDNLRSLGVEGKRGIERLRAFYNFMEEGGSAQFVNRELLEGGEESVLYKVQDCPFTRFFKEAGMLELATCICKIDNAFFCSSIPDYAFSREDSWRNTSAYGKEYCLFSFRKKAATPDERYIGETPLLDYTHPAIQVLFEKLDLPYRSDREKISHFYEYVRREIRPVRHEKKRHPASAILRKGRGDDMSKTILFMALLRAGGIPCRVHFKKSDEGAVSCTELYFDNRWKVVAPWTDGSDGVSPDQVGWERGGSGRRMESPGEDHAVYDSPDKFFHSRSPLIQ